MTATAVSMMGRKRDRPRIHDGLSEVHALLQPEFDEVLRTEPALFEERSKNEDRIVPVGEGLAEL
jgi:hypothetical protein